MQAIKCVVVGDGSVSHFDDTWHDMTTDLSYWDRYSATVSQSSHTVDSLTQMTQKSLYMYFVS